MRKLSVILLSASSVLLFSCSGALNTAYTAYSTYKNTKETVKGYQNLKNLASLTRIRPVFYGYKSVKVEVQLKNVEGRDNEKLGEALKDNIEYQLRSFFKNYDIEGISVCEEKCEEPFIIIRFKERSYKSVLQKWALKGKYGGKIEYIDGKTGNVLLEDRVENKETFYDIARTVGQVLELKVFRTGLQRFVSVSDNKGAKKYMEKHKLYLNKRSDKKYINQKYAKILKKT